MADFADHDAYIAAAPEPFQAPLTNLRRQLAQALPDAKEIISYNMPGFQIGTAIIAGYAAFTKQCGLYVADDAITAHADQVAANGLKATKTGVTFSVRKPLPDDLAVSLAQSSRAALGL